MLTILKDKYFYADNSKFIPQVPTGMPYRHPSYGLLRFKRRPFSENLCKIKINDIQTLKMLTTFKVKYFYSENRIIIPQAHKGMPYRIAIPFAQVGLFKF